MIKINRLLIGVFALSLFFTPLLGQAQSFSEGAILPADNEEIIIVKPPLLFISDILLDKSSFNAGDTITGNFTILNQEKPEHPYYTGLSYKIELWRPFDQNANFMDPSNSILVGAEIFKENIGIVSNSSKEQMFNFALPKNLLDGKYILSVSLIDLGGLPIALGVGQPFFINNSGGTQKEAKFLEIQHGIVLKNDEQFSLLEGPVLEQNEEVSVLLYVLNHGSDVFKAGLKGVIRDRSEVGGVVQSFEGNEYSFQPQERTTAEVKLPNINKPGAYLAIFGFYENDESVSPKITVRFVVAGEGARILNIFADKAIYDEGDIAKISVYAVGPADTVYPGYINGKKTVFVEQEKAEDFRASLAVKIFDTEDNQLVGSAEKEVNLHEQEAWSVSEFSFPITKKLALYRVEAEIIKNDVILDKAVINNEGIVPKKNNLIYYFVLGGLLLFGIIMIMLQRSKRSKKNNIQNFKIIFLFIFVAGGLTGFASTVAADYTFPFAAGTVVWQSPYNNQTYEQDDTIVFRVNVWSRNSWNTYSAVRLWYYIDGSKLSSPIIHTVCEVNSDRCGYRSVYAGGEEPTYEEFPAYCCWEEPYGEEVSFSIGGTMSSGYTFPYPANLISPGWHKAQVKGHYDSTKIFYSGAIQKRSGEFELPERDICIIGAGVCPGEISSCPVVDQSNPHSVCQDNQCVSVSGCGENTCLSNVDCLPPPPPPLSPQTLSVVLSANPSSGTAPLQGVDLSAQVSGTAQGTINYKFDCTNDGTYEYVFEHINDNPKTVQDACKYTASGTYTARVFTERGSAPSAQDFVQIMVSSAPLPPPPACPISGEVDPHYECNTETGNCFQVSGCGPSQAACEASCEVVPECPAGQSKPYSRCAVGICQIVEDQCGTTECAIDTDCPSEYIEIKGPVQKVFAWLGNLFR